jgi:peroxidase
MVLNNIAGSHTLGITHCLNILNRLYKPEGVEAQGILMDPAFEAFLRLTCPKGSLISNITFVLNDVTPTLFDNHYYMNAMGGRGVLTIDAEMVIDPRTAQIVEHFATNQDDFFHAFSTAFLKLSSSGVLTGDQGVIRRKCNVID